MSKVRTGIFFSAADKYATQALAVATMAIMSRLLTPAETGLYLVANGLILLADQFRAFGVGVYIVQERELDRNAVRAGFTVTFAISLAIGAAVWASADLVAAFYGDPALARLLVIAALAFAVIPFGSPVIALLQRELAFGMVARINVTAAVAGFVVTVGLGLAGFGPDSYLWGFVATSATLAVMAFAVRPETWIYRPSLRRARRVLSFGITSSAVTLINVAYDMLPRLAFGKMLGFDAVGLYSRALTVCQLPDRMIGSALQPVMLPAMAAEARAQGDLKASYLHGHALMSAAQWPALVLLALLADPVVRILLGNQWGEAVPLVRIVAMANMALAPAFMTFPLLVSLGRIRDALTASLISLPPSAAITIFAANFGLTAVAASLFVTAPFQMLVALYFIRRVIGLTWGELLRASGASAAVTAATAACPVLVILLSADGLALGWGGTALALGGAALGWVAAVMLLDHPLRRELCVIADMAAGVLSRRRAARAPQA
ncbi:oligosaccharide flippase family protein [Paracoccus sp. S-4012]|uniref:lipopolysaccharide biosynthesis protein n=1 Tax=Paracoccus sp. S-4012 TaxID=2665648 RepID=UPI0012B09CDA|nr:lipopolysaccharide biosynthesis protein [Paracoccus sp. S-4012]MRX51816.1 oligosaccharide flippase family protein [Paracoccus sp. S-4012]